MFYIDYATFLQLENEAQEYDNFDMYVQERGWQAWMEVLAEDDNNPEMIIKFLESIYQTKDMNLSELRTHLGTFESRAEMARYFQIPLRTLENWDFEKSKGMDHEMLLIKYVMILKFWNQEPEEDHD